MKKLPKKAAIVCGDAEGKTKLESLDNALLDAGVGDLNLVEVTSILPEKCQIVERINPKPGTVTPVAMAKISSSNPEDRLVASIAVAKSVGSHGVITEFEGKNLEKTEAKKRAEKAGRRMLKKRNLEVKEIQTTAAGHKVINNGSVVAAVIFQP